VAQHDDVDVARRQVEPAHVLYQAIRGAAGVEEHPRRTPALLDGDQGREAVLGAQGVVRRAVHRDPRGNPWRRGHRRPLRRSLRRQKRVGHIVNQRCDGDAIDRLERDCVHRDFQSRPALVNKQWVALRKRAFGAAAHG
jgi:hypothetical protein